MIRVRFGAPSTYSTVQSDSVGAEGGSTGARRGFNRLFDRRDVFVRLEPLLEIEVSLSLDEASPSSRRESSFSTAPFNARWQLLLDRLEVVREPLLDRLVLHPREPRMINRSLHTRAPTRGFFIFITSQQYCTSRAERAIARYAHNVRRGSPVHDCDMGPIPWRNQEMREDFGHVEVLAPLDRPSQPVDLGLVLNQPWDAQDTVERVIHIEDDEVVVAVETIERVRQRQLSPCDTARLPIRKLDNHISRKISHGNAGGEDRQTLCSEEVVCRS
ncbi:hypothetical protein PR002_g30303 [Phytophthora rubi]|uniref:Uncharacterized protein n=1 Tax=Phytophthora rubi TaxID=129364 RepID=A0A6A3GTC7_9STRA|nr:hypothetical protein PR002_g30303 [Phytophthora rubi]